MRTVTQSELAEIVGAANVISDETVLGGYAGDQSFVGSIPPRFIAKVDSREAVQKLVNLARETATPLVPVSSGGPHFYGDTVPSAAGAVVVDLSGMKKVDLVDTFERVASVVEPGVTFGELIPIVAEKGLRLNMPLQPRATKSVVGSMLSREPVIMPHYHWDISDPIGSTEVVFGTGDMFRTGAAAGPGSIEEQRAAGGRQKEAAGPFGHVAPPPVAGSPGHHGHRHVGFGPLRADPRQGAALLRHGERPGQAHRSGGLAPPAAAGQRAAHAQRGRRRRPVRHR